jgi:hypothetical protein
MPTSKYNVWGNAYVIEQETISACPRAFSVPVHLARRETEIGLKPEQLSAVHRHCSEAFHSNDQALAKFPVAETELCYEDYCLLEQCFSTFMRPRPSKFLFYKTRAQSQQIYS